MTDDEKLFEAVTEAWNAEFSRYRTGKWEQPDGVDNVISAALRKK